MARSGSGINPGVEIQLGTAYDNYRDDHDYSRQLTHSGGVLRWTGQTFEVPLLPRVNYSPALQRIIVTLLEQFDTTQPQLPDGSHRPLKFFLSDRDDFEIRLKGTHYNVSKPLRLLKAAGLMEMEKAGQQRLYAVVPRLKNQLAANRRCWTWAAARSGLTSCRSSLPRLRRVLLICLE
jgi:hypothetical protein